MRGFIQKVKVAMGEVHIVTHPAPSFKPCLSFWKSEHKKTRRKSKSI